MPSTSVRKISVDLGHFKNHNDSAETEQYAGPKIARCNRNRGCGNTEALEVLQEEAQGSLVESGHSFVRT